MSNSELPPAGWYPDPSMPGVNRWWDGVAWTERYEIAQSSADPIVVASDPEPVAVSSRRELRELVGALVTDEPEATATVPASTASPSHWSDSTSTGSSADWPTFEWTPGAPTATTSTSTAVGYTPLQSMASTPTYLHQVRGSAQTWQGWLIALSPVWGMLLLLPTIPSYVTAMTAQDQTDLTPLLPMLGASLLSLGLIIWLVIGDRRVLRERGYDPPWAILLFVAVVAYFVLRIVRTGKGSVGMLVGYLVASVLSYVIAIAFVFWGMSMLYPGLR